MPLLNAALEEECLILVETMPCAMDDLHNILFLGRC